MRGRQSEGALAGRDSLSMLDLQRGERNGSAGGKVRIDFHIEPRTSGNGLRQREQESKRDAVHDRRGREGQRISRDRIAQPRPPNGRRSKHGRNA